MVDLNVINILFSADQVKGLFGLIEFPFCHAVCALQEAAGHVLLPFDR